MTSSSIKQKVPSQPAPADVSLISELYEAIATSPPAIEERRLLVQLLMNCEWFEAAREATSELLAIVPADGDAQALLTAIMDAQADVVPAAAKPAQIFALDIGDIAEASSRVEEEHKTLFTKVKVLWWETTFLHKILQYQHRSNRPSQQSFSSASKNQSVAQQNGERASSIRRTKPNPPCARKVANQMERDPTRAMEIAFLDLKYTNQWLRSAEKCSIPESSVTAPSEGAYDDVTREALQKRTQALISSLPLKMQQDASTAQMHVEHEILHRTYICAETMYGDPVLEIPREKFWVTEDGYPWDMEELTQAITSNGGVMRNPLSKQLFTPNDVKAIVRHPLGNSLAALQLTQREMSKGVRPRTVGELAKMSEIMLKDDSSDQMESRHVIDEFLAYVATLPEAEQKALDKLRVPARDSHTGQPFDSSIGEAVRDAQGNRVCIHKIGDFLSQAARHLRQKG